MITPLESPVDEFPPDEESDKDDFEDAVEIPAIPQSLDLNDSIHQTQIALNLFLNNRFEEAKLRMQPWAKQSMYHTLGYSTILYIQAMMTFEMKDITTAIDQLKVAVQVCNRQRKQTSIKGHMARVVLRSPDEYTVEQMHAELCYAECLLERALLTFVEDESLTCFVKGALKIRACYQSYKECQRILHDHAWSCENQELRNHFESGVRMGVGAFNLLIAQLPPRILRLLEFVGFSGDKQLGLNMLSTASAMHETLRAPLCSLLLLTYHTLGTFVLGVGECDEDLCDRLLVPLLNNYPKGALVLYFAGRLSEIKGNLSVAINYLNESISSQSSWNQFHHLCYWELLFCHAFQRNYAQAAEYAQKLFAENRWSRATYSYLCGIFLYAQAQWMRSTDERDRMRKYFQQVPNLKQRIAGKSIPIEKYCVVKSQRYFKHNELILPQYEIIYLWNGFSILARNESLLKPVLDDIECALDSHLKLKDFDADSRCLCLLLKAVCLRHLNCSLQAEDCLLEIIRSEKQLGDHMYLVPNAYVELALVYLTDGRVQPARQALAKAKEYKAYLLESRVHFRIHAVLEKLKD